MPNTGRPPLTTSLHQVVGKALGLSPEQVRIALKQPLGRGKKAKDTAQEYLPQGHSLLPDERVT